MTSSIVPPSKCCSKCGNEHPVTTEFFGQRKSGTFRGVCRDCDRKRGRDWYVKNRDKKLAQNKEWFDNHPEKQAEYLKRYNEKHPDRRKESGKKYRLKNRARLNAASLEYHYEHREELNQRRRDYYYDNIDYERERNAKYREENQERLEQYNIEYRERNREIINARNRVRYHANPEKQKAIRDARKDKMRAASRQSYLKNRDVILARMSKRHKDNPRLAVIAAERRLARKRSLPDTLTLEQWETAIDYWGYKCAVCERLPDFWTVLAADHWIPIKSDNCPGTVHTNIIPVCHSRKDGEGGCNNSKSNRDPVEFVTMLLGKRKAKKKLAEIEAFFNWMHERFEDKAA